MFSNKRASKILLQQDEDDAAPYDYDKFDKYKDEVKRLILKQLNSPADDCFECSVQTAYNRFMNELLHFIHNTQQVKCTEVMFDNQNMEERVYDPRNTKYIRQPTIHSMFGKY